MCVNGLTGFAPEGIERSEVITPRIESYSGRELIGRDEASDMTVDGGQARPRRSMVLKSVWRSSEKLMLRSIYSAIASRRGSSTASTRRRWRPTSRLRLTRVGRTTPDSRPVVKGAARLSTEWLQSAEPNQDRCGGCRRGCPMPGKRFA